MMQLFGTAIKLKKANNILKKHIFTRRIKVWKKQILYQKNKGVEKADRNALSEFAN